MKKHYFVFLVALLFSHSVIRGQNTPVDVNIYETYQTMEGFGGFGPKKVWWSSPPFYDQAYIDLIIDDLGVSILRTQLYWDFEESNDNNDPKLINWDGFNFDANSNNGKQFPFIRDLADAGLDKLIATVWTPPVWMKLDVDNSLAGFCNGQCGGYLNPQYYEEFAEYCVAYILKLKEETGVDLYAISLQNELAFANPFESCVYTPDQFHDMLKVVGKRFEDEGLTTKIFGPEHMAAYQSNQPYLEATFNDPETREYLDIWAVHGYLDGVNPTTGEAKGWISLHEDCERYDKQLWMTETSGFDDNYNGAFDLGKALYVALKHGKINAWVFWYMSGNIMTNNVPNDKYYVFKHWYRYVEPGAIQVESQSADDRIWLTSFIDRDNRRLTMVLLNTNETEKRIDIDYQNQHPAFTRYLTTSTYHCQNMGNVSPEGVILPAKSVTTLVAEGTNYLPTIDQIADQAILKDAARQSIALTGITNGGDASQQVSLTITTDEPDKFSELFVEHTPGQETATLYYTPNNQDDSVKIIVKANDGSTADNGFFSEWAMTFNLNILPFVNQPPSLTAPSSYTCPNKRELQTIELTNITDGDDGSQNISMEVSYSGDKIVRNLSITRTGETTGAINFYPTGTGVTTLTIRVKDDGGTEMNGKDSLIVTLDLTITAESNIPMPSDQLLRVYPNPTRDLLTIILPDNYLLNGLMINDLTGKLIYSEQVENYSGVKKLDISHLTPGYYQLILNTSQGLIKQKLLIQ